MENNATHIAKATAIASAAFILLTSLDVLAYLQP
jgi:hypothetical protein